MPTHAPQKLQLDITAFPKLNHAQAGHLRHFHNLATQPDGEWRHMGTLEPAQEFLDAYRYQLATMAYATGAAHYHRLPAMRALFRALLDALIRKMLRRDVWGYWFQTSHSGNRMDPGRTELRKPWSDPIVKENIMYSGHLLLMTSLYAMLFDDDRYEQPGALTFRWDPLFWGLGEEVHAYDNRSVQAAVLAEMERNGWVGVCCEPNAVFVVCNQFPIIAMRYNDARDGTAVAEETLVEYKAAWEKKMVGPDGLYPNFWLVNQDKIVPAQGVGLTAWANAFMNSWNSDLVHDLYPQQSLGFITNINTQIRLQTPAVAREFRTLVTKAQADPQAATTLARAQDAAKSLPPPPSKHPYSEPSIGYIVQWLSELGKTTELDGLLAYADAKLGPRWEEGGLFYPRNDTSVDGDGELVHMDPFSGNAAIGYARLNVPDGQKMMWDRPWTGEELAARPWIDGVELGQGVDCLRGIWDEGKGVLVVTLRTWDRREVEVRLMARNLAAGRWTVYVNGELVRCDEVVSGSSLGVLVKVGGEEVDMVFQKLSSV